MSNEMAKAWISSALADLKSIGHIIDDEFLTQGIPGIWDCCRTENHP
jgi:hypothetical protein